MIDKNTDEIDFIEIYRSLVKEKFIVLTTVALCSLLAIIYSLLLPNIYTSSSTLTISESSGNQQNMLSGLGGLAGLPGINLGATTSKNSYAQTIIFSRQFLEHLLKRNQIKHFITAAESYEYSSDKITFNTNYNFESNNWNKDKKGLSLEPSLLETHKIYKNMVSYKEDSETGYMELSVSHISPAFAKKLLGLIITETNNLSRIIDLNDSTEALEYYYKQLKETSQVEVRQSINTLIEMQLKKKMMANVKEDYLLEVLDKPFVPEEKSSPVRTLIVLYGILAGFILSCLIVFYKKRT